MKTCVVTIVSGNYLAYARALGGSLLAIHADIDFRVLIVDRKTLPIQSAIRESGLNCVFAEDLSLTESERLFYKFDIVELNTALKPTFIKQVFSLGYERVIYLDPDIRVFSKLSPVLDALEDASIVLTPHSMAPIMDSLRPSDVDFLRTGAYNLGFIALKSSTQVRDMLDWWESRCLGMGFNDITFGVFVDQKWIDLVPSYFSSVKILRHPGCNVAYWNLHERQIALTASGMYMINGYDLIFFHFSGVVPSNPSILSKHQTRYKIDIGTPLSCLVRDYCKELSQFSNEAFSNIPYGFGALDDGTQITQTMRRALLVVPYKVSNPFSSSSYFQRQLRSFGIVRVGIKGQDKPINTMTFNPNDWKVKLVNYCLRVAVRLIGINRLLPLLRYTSLLTREAHLASVLLNQPLGLEHRLRR